MKKKIKKKKKKKRIKKKIKEKETNKKKDPLNMRIIKKVITAIQIIQNNK